ncbi:MAG: UbiD family decarboxylase, partial [Armatimonadetes bacterium]|nr:UbiD family decarboxylase [Armatimonadota bacterium]
MPLTHPVPNNLQEFISRLEAAGELKRIARPIDPVLEITEIADRVVKGGGPALLFENPKGSDIPVLINAYGSWKRVALALGGRHIEEIAAEIEDLVKLNPPKGISELIGAGKKALGLFKAIPRTAKGPAPCQEVVMDPPDLTHLPILQCWPEDGGRYITLPLVFSKDPRTGKRNCGMYRIQVFDATTTAMHWQIHKVGARHFQDVEEENKPVVVPPRPAPEDPHPAPEGGGHPPRGRPQ